jgi:hypothetical protein
MPYFGSYFGPIETSGGGGGITLEQLQTELAVIKGDGFNPATDTLEDIASGTSDSAAIASAVVAALAGQTVIVAPSVDEERGELTIVEGEEKTFSFSITGWTGTNQDGQTISLRMMDRLTYDGESTTATSDIIATGTATQTGQTIAVSITVTDTQSASLTPTNPPQPGFTHVAQLWGAGPEVLRTYNVTVKRGVRIGS